MRNRSKKNSKSAASYKHELEKHKILKYWIYLHSNIFFFYSIRYTYIILKAISVRPWNITRNLYQLGNRYMENIIKM